MNPKFDGILRDTAILLAASAFLAFAYNELSSKRLPWLRVEKNRVMASDSLINSLSSTTSQATTSQTASKQVSSSQTSTPSAAQMSNGVASGNTAKASPNLASKTETIKTESVKQDTKQTPSKENKAPVETVSGKTSAKPEQHQASGQQNAGAPVKPLEIRMDQVEKLLANPDVLFIDARKANEYERGHIGNAINIFTPEFEQNIPRVIGLPRDKPIVVYCGGGACELSHELAAHLVGLGFTRVFVYTGGWNEWEKKKG